MQGKKDYQEKLFAISTERADSKAQFLQTLKSGSRIGFPLWSDQTVLRGKWSKKY